jgi:hypothetical protein
VRFQSFFKMTFPLVSSRIIISGGIDKKNNSLLSKVEYTNCALMFYSIPAMPEVSVCHCMAVLQSGDICVAGGSNRHSYLKKISRGVLRYFTQTWRNNSFRCLLRRLPRPQDVGHLRLRYCKLFIPFYNLNCSARERAP